MYNLTKKTKACKKTQKKNQWALGWSLMETLNPFYFLTKASLLPPNDHLFSPLCSLFKKPHHQKPKNSSLKLSTKHTPKKRKKLHSLLSFFKLQNGQFHSFLSPISAPFFASPMSTLWHVSFKAIYSQRVHES